MSMIRYAELMKFCTTGYIDMGVYVVGKEILSKIGFVPSLKV
jgi:hypothetical protein